MATSRQTRIIVVSDNEIITKQIASILGEEKYTYRTAKDGPDALAALKRYPIDVIITSSTLVGMSGLQLSQAARRIHPQLQVIIFTEESNDPILKSALASGVTDCISWPYECAKLPSAVERAVCTLKHNTRRLIEDRSGVLYKLVHAFAGAVDAKSYYTLRHTSRVTEMCEKIASALGLSLEEAATLEIAAMVHDLGKIGTPDLVLAKPEALSDEEWVDVLKHPDLGSSILAQVDELAEVAAIVRHHHERVDGTGYPDGLVGEAIPKLARILCVVDAYEAMTSERPYRPALSHAEAINELIKGKGTQFDADIVDAFVNAITELDSEEIRAA